MLAPVGMTAEEQELGHVRRRAQTRPSNSGGFPRAAATHTVYKGRGFLDSLALGMRTPPPYIVENQ